MGQVDKIFQQKIAQVVSDMNARLTRAGISSTSFADIFNTALSNSETNQTTTPYANLGAITGTRASTSPGGKIVLPDENKYNDLINQAAVKYDLDPNLIKAVMRLESQFKRYALSSSGAMGLMQLMPGTAESRGVTDPYDPEQNIDGGAQTLRKHIDRFGDVRLALAGYYTGANRVARYGITDPNDEVEYNKLPERVQYYIERVMNNYIQYTKQSDT